MLVDDHALVRAAVRQAIDGAGVELVAEAATAEDAFALALSVRPDVLLLDIDLPGMSGLQMLEELAPRLPETKIVMLTVSDSERDMLDSVSRGAAGYLTKDLSPEALLRALRGTQRGELAMSRRFAARAIRHFAEASRRSAAGSGGGGAIEGLSPRENDVLRMLAEGLTDREIAARAHHLAADRGDPRLERAPQAQRAQPRRGRAALPRERLTRASDAADLQPARVGSRPLLIGGVVDAVLDLRVVGATGVIDAFHGRGERVGAGRAERRPADRGT